MRHTFGLTCIQLFQETLGYNWKPKALQKKSKFSNKKNYIFLKDIRLQVNKLALIKSFHVPCQVFLHFKSMTTPETGHQGFDDE